MHATTGDPQPVASSPPLLPDPNRHIVHVVRVLNDATLLAVVGDTFFIHDHLRAAEGRFTSPRPWTPGQHSGGVVVGRDRVVTPGWLFAADQHSDLIALLGSLHGLLVVDQFPLSAEDATLPCQLERDVLGILDKLRVRLASMLRATCVASGGDVAHAGEGKGRVEQASCCSCPVLHFPAAQWAKRHDVWLRLDLGLCTSVPGS